MSDHRSKTPKILFVSFDEHELDLDEEGEVIYPDHERFGPCEDDAEDKLTQRENVFDLGHVAEESYGTEYDSPLNFCGNSYERASCMHERRQKDLLDAQRE